MDLLITRYGSIASVFTKMSLVIPSVALIQNEQANHVQIDRVAFVYK